MSMTNKIINFLKMLFEYLVFQNLGIPKIKNSDISKNVIKKYIPFKPVIVEAGAHNGSDSIQLARMMKGSVYAFEPIPSLYKELCKKTAKYKNITCYNLALGEKDGQYLMYMSSGSSDASSSILKPKEHLIDHPEVKFENNILVNSISLDTWIEKNNVTSIDLLWLDLQGYEFKLLSSSPKALSIIKAMHIEVNTKQTYEDVMVYSDFKKYLKSKGFRVVLEAITKNSDGGNVFLIKE